MSEEQQEEVTENTEEVQDFDLGEAIAMHIANMSPTEKEMQLRILLLLNQSARFQQFMNDNFDIHTSVNHENQEIDIAVIEKPLVKEVEFKGGELSLDVAKSLKAQMFLKGLGVEKTADAIKKLYEILGGTEENAIIASASDADINKEIAAQKEAAKLIVK